MKNHLVLQYLWFNQILDKSIPKIEIAKVFATKEKTNYSAKEIIPIVCIVSKMRNWKNLEIWISNPCLMKSKWIREIITVTYVFSGDFPSWTLYVCFNYFLYFWCIFQKKKNFLKVSKTGAVLKYNKSGKIDNVGVLK